MDCLTRVERKQLGAQGSFASKDSKFQKQMINWECTVKQEGVSVTNFWLHLVSPEGKKSGMDDGVQGTSSECV